MVSLLAELERALRLILVIVIALQSCRAQVDGNFLGEVDGRTACLGRG